MGWNRKWEKEDNDTEIRKDKNNQINQIVWRFEKDTLGDNPMFIISDIYGNNFKVIPQKEVKWWIYKYINKKI